MFPNWTEIAIRSIPRTEQDWLEVKMGIDAYYQVVVDLDGPIDLSLNTDVALETHLKRRGLVLSAVIYRLRKRYLLILYIESPGPWGLPFDEVRQKVIGALQATQAHLSY